MESLFATEPLFAMIHQALSRLLIAILWFVGFSWSMSTSMSTSIASEPSLVEFTNEGRSYVGLSLARSLSTWLILSNDGQLHYLESEAAFRDVKTLDGDFVPASTIELRSSLVREFGPSFEVIATQHFLVVQPRGRGTKWPDTFEQLHRQFTHQLRQRGVNVRKGKFPMVAVVMPDRAMLHAELNRQKLPTANIAGIYIANSNRVYTHDSGNDSSTLPVLRHEAAHQSAFNSNIHSRLNATPKWITEGLGMMFEPAAMADGRSSTVLQRAQMDALVKLRIRYSDEQNSLPIDVRRLIADDIMFEHSRDVEHAYNISWLMMFYLSERRPAVFAKYLNLTTSRPPFIEYSKQQRLNDFQSITGQTIDTFASDLTRFVESLAK